MRCVAGAIYLAIIVLGGYSEGVIINALRVAGDTPATLRNILA